MRSHFLMFLLALVCFDRATRWPSRLWKPALPQHMAYIVALVIHIPLILLETFALLWKAPFFDSPLLPGRAG